MSILSGMNRPAGRCDLAAVLALAGALAAAPIVGSAAAAELRDGVFLAAASQADTRTRSEKTYQTASALRDLWVDHIFWVRNVALAALNRDDAAVASAEQRAVANAKAIAATLRPFYGAEAEQKFFKLLAGHYNAVKAYLMATIAGNASDQETATQSLTSNAEEIATFLSKANPYLPKDALDSLLIAHGGHHIQQIQQLQDRDYDAEASTWEAMKAHIYQIADATADALAKQFVKKL